MLHLHIKKKVRLNRVWPSWHCPKGALVYLSIGSTTELTTSANKILDTSMQAQKFFSDRSGSHGAHKMIVDIYTL